MPMPSPMGWSDSALGLRTRAATRTFQNSSLTNFRHPVLGPRSPFPAHPETPRQLFAPLHGDAHLPRCAAASEPAQLEELAGQGRHPACLPGAGAARGVDARPGQPANRAPRDPRRRCPGRRALAPGGGDAVAIFFERKPTPRDQRLRHLDPEHTRQVIVAGCARAETMQAPARPREASAHRGLPALRPRARRRPRQGENSGAGLARERGENPRRGACADGCSRWTSTPGGLRKLARRARTIVHEEHQHRKTRGIRDESKAPWPGQGRWVRSLRWPSNHGTALGATFGGNRNTRPRKRSLMSPIAGLSTPHANDVPIGSRAGPHRRRAAVGPYPSTLPWPKSLRLIGGSRAFCELMLLMDDGARPAGELAKASGVSMSTASSHLHKALAAGFLRVHAQGRHRYFRLARADVRARGRSAGRPRCAEPHEGVQAPASFRRGAHLLRSPGGVLGVEGDAIAGRAGLACARRKIATASRHRAPRARRPGHRPSRVSGRAVAGWPGRAIDSTERRPHLAGKLVTPGPQALRAALARTRPRTAGGARHREGARRAGRGVSGWRWKGDLGP